MRKIDLSVIGAVITLAFSLILFAPALGTANGPQGEPPILDNLPPTWSKLLPADQRFEVVLNGAGVLDKETGLVWQQSPWRSTWAWDAARAQCNSIEIGGRLGWHLPTVEQLTSLIDRTSDSGKMVPVGHPFGTVYGHYPYWTATPYPGAPGFALMVDFVEGTTSGAALDNMYHIWCVRGGQSYF